MSEGPTSASQPGAPRREPAAPSEPGRQPAPLAGLYEGTLDCVHCGLCLSSCPTYRATGRETSSPRGRVYLMRGVAEGRLPLESLVEEAYLCLGCRACETACPSGVEFGHLLEETRAEIERAGLRHGLAKRVESFALRRVVPRPAVLRGVVSLRGRVALFEGCLMPELFGAVNAATARVLARQGFEVVVPRGQGCCGALQAHAGDAGFARELAARNVAALAEGELDALILNSAGCGAALREYGSWLGPAGAGLAARVRDVCEFLDEVGLRGPLAPLPGSVCYDDPCHLVHGQRVEAAPRRLLAQIPELRLVPHREASACCGAAGIYNLTHREMSAQILARKMDALAEVDPDWIATGNPGCLMQLASGARTRHLRAEVLHPIELLDRSLERGRT